MRLKRAALFSYYEMCNFSFYERHKVRFYLTFTRKFLHYITTKAIRRNFCS